MNWILLIATLLVFLIVFQGTYIHIKLSLFRAICTTNGYDGVKVNTNSNIWVMSLAAAGLYFLYQSGYL